MAVFSYDAALRKGASVLVTPDASAGVAPAIVQSVGNKSTATSYTVTLPSSPTPGNYLYALMTGFGGFTSVTGAGWEYVYVDNQSNYQYQYAAIIRKRVSSGDPASYTFSFGSSPMATFLIEVSGAENAYASGGRATIGTSTLSYSTAYTPNALNLLVLEADTTHTLVSSSGPGTLLYDASAPGNHSSYFYRVTGTGTITATLNSTPTTGYIGMTLTLANSGAIPGKKAWVLSGTGNVLTNAKIPQTKSYFEMVLDGAYSGTPRIGIATAEASLTSLLGTDALSCGYDKTGQVRINNVAVATIGAYNAGDTIGVAVDNVNRLIWYRVNNGNWNNDAAQNPATSVGGISLATMNAASVLPAFGATASAAAMLMTSTPMFSYTPPSGFAAPDDEVVSGINGSQRTHNSTGVNGKPSSFPAYGRTVSLIPRKQKTAFVVKTGVLKGGWFKNAYTWTPAGPHTTVTGVVKQEDVAIAGKKVFLYDTLNGDKLGSAISASDGTFTIPARGRINTFVVALDPNYQAIVYDRVIPA